MQKRLPKYGRDLRSRAAVATRQITDTSLALIATIHDYKVIPTSLLVRLVEGSEKNLYRQLQQLYHKGLVNRFAFMRRKNPGEFHYYLDNTEALNLLVASGATPADLEFQEARRNREKRYCDVNNPNLIEEMQGRLLFLKHVVMISRFHGMLELACVNSNRRIELTDFQQGPALWNKVEVPKVLYRNGKWQDSDQREQLPHRPDAFFTLTIHNENSHTQLHFLYEADRHRTNAQKYNRKLRARFHFVVKQKLYNDIYGINRVRAVLTETVDDEWAEYLRNAAAHPVVSGSKPSPLFWFTTSRLFTGDSDSKMPTYLAKPEIIFKKIWATPADDNLYSLFD